ncbi:hypothetical protein K788_0006622 [Paraburkholderia caribensis MBA4]|uniref:Uncharacterized protein n=1 Tax=Paraburkholderia caribensis MBA4 TaxID=1323664 RepID=A0A0P0R8L6_9BURK|nr:hypothetical protein K788_0006622 [Paraburkholderia caribensis MBA4]
MDLIEHGCSSYNGSRRAACLNAQRRGGPVLVTCGIVGGDDYRPSGSGDDIEGIRFVQCNNSALAHSRMSYPRHRQFARFL